MFNPDTGNDDSPNLESTIWKVMREEIVRTNTRNIFSRTQSLIHSASSRVAESSNVQPIALNNFQMQEKSKRSHPGHPSRFAISKKSKISKMKSKMFNVILLPQNLEESDCCRCDVENELLSGYCELSPQGNDLTIRKALVKVFKTKFPLINVKDFEYVKRSKNMVSLPSVPEDFTWNFDAIKAIAGQGKLCCRLQWMN